jgi:SpoVK/Ycf46/Vps4 family AAA+-type ATPase
MARGELLRKLFLSHSRGNDQEFRAAALQVIAEEERKSNHRLAKDLMRILDNGGPKVLAPPVAGQGPEVLPKDRERQTSLVGVRQPDRHLQDILLGKEPAGVVERILQEYRKAELLRVHGLMPSTKLLFCGPPGCGKTLCSEIIATELGLPLLYTRFDAIVSSYLGETSANLRKVFEYANSGRWVVLFDEFDAIGKARDDATEHGEIKRVINSFLQLLDAFDAPSILIAATNHEHLLDPALWRRFDEVLMFPRPSVHEIRSLLGMKLKNFPRSGVDLRVVATRLKGMAHADVERVCFDAIKIAVLQGKDSIDQEIFDRSVEQQRARRRITEGASNRQ